MPGPRLAGGGGQQPLTQGSPRLLSSVLMFCHAPHCPWSDRPPPQASQLPTFHPQPASAEPRRGVPTLRATSPLPGRPGEGPDKQGRPGLPRPLSQPPCPSRRNKGGSCCSVPTWPLLSGPGRNSPLPVDGSLPNCWLCHRYCSATRSRPTPVDCSTPGLSVLHHLRTLLRLMSTESVSNNT